MMNGVQKAVGSAWKMIHSSVRSVGLIGLVLGLSACAATGTQLGAWGAKTPATGAAAGSSSQRASTDLVRCDVPIGTIALVEQQAPWFISMQRYGVESTLPVLRLMVQQSNCFVVVERGRAMASMQAERALGVSGELRSGSRFGGGQMVAADYTVEPSLTFSEPNVSGLQGLLGGQLGSIGRLIGAGLNLAQASTVLTVIDNRSGVQVLVAEGSASGANLGGFLGLGGRKFGGGLGAYTRTPEAKVIVAAIMDAYNSLVRASEGYTEQGMAGGLGRGGQLSVAGSQPKPPWKK